MTTDVLKVLIVDDQPAVVRALEVLFDLHDLPSVSATSPEEALGLLARESIGVVVQDMNFSGRETSGDEGASLFRALREAQPSLPIVLITAWASLETAVELVREGAADYVEKPWKDDQLIVTVSNLLRIEQLEVENDRLRSELAASRAELADDHNLCGLVYASEAMHRLLSLAVQVAPSEAPILITGPSGSGKERIAEVVQANSRRRDRPFLRVNVGAIPEALMEAELFGAEPGAYTGQQGRREGLFKAADGGTLFLDEIDSLSPAGQVKLLRVLQSGEMQRLGSSRPDRVDVRVISATNAELPTALAEGRFREDLFFRLNVVELAVPALDDRSRDVLPLVRHFVTHFARREGAAPGNLSAEAERSLLAHAWPGNVRELENRVQRALLLAGGEDITANHLGLDDREVSAAVELTAVETAERDELLVVLSEEHGIVARAAERLGMSRQALYRKMNRLDVELERRPKSS